MEEENGLVVSSFQEYDEDVPKIEYRMGISLHV